MVRVRSYPGPGLHRHRRAGLSAPQSGDPHGAACASSWPIPTLLLPDMYAEAEIDTGAATPVLAVPDSAVIDSGDRQVVIVDKGEGRFEPRAGASSAPRRRLRRDPRRRARADELVVTPPISCIDAESNLKAALKGLTGGSAAMIARLIAGSARNIMLVMIGTAFAVVAGLYALLHLPLDAIPDLSDTQVIVYTEYPGAGAAGGRGSGHLSAGHARCSPCRGRRVVRGFSYFGVSFVYVIFEDGTDIYWARSRVLEYLNAAARPVAGGRDAERSGRTRPASAGSTNMRWSPRTRSLAELRSLQDWYVRYRPRQGGRRGRGRQRRRLRQAIQRGDRSQRLRELRHFAVEGPRRDPRQQHGCRRPHASSCPSSSSSCAAAAISRASPDLQKIVLKNDGGTPVLLQDVARVELGPDERRGITELNGEGEVASGIVLQRFGANALDVIDNVKKRLAELAASLPEGRRDPAGL